jgi:branched-chain amino acid transport system permease protein
VSAPAAGGAATASRRGAWGAAAVAAGLVYVAAAGGSGAAGALYFLMNLRISPDAAFGVSWSSFIIFIVVIGGIGTLEGPIVGTLLFFALRELLADRGAWYLIALGAVAVLAMLVCPQGIWGWVGRRFDLHVFPVQRRVRRRDRARGERPRPAPGGPESVTCRSRDENPR